MLIEKKCGWCKNLTLKHFDEKTKNYNGTCNNCKTHFSGINNSGNLEKGEKIVSVKKN